MAWWMIMGVLVSAPAQQAAGGLAMAKPACPAVPAPLRPTPPLRFAATMKHGGTPASFGGLLASSIARAGRYHVALGASAWIDVVRDDATLASVAHGHGPDCSGIRKIVDYDLTPGGHLLQGAGNDAPPLGVMVAPVG